MAKSIYGLCNPLLDIMADGDDALLKKYNLKPADAILADETHIPLYEELANSASAKFVPGGATLNSIRVANWILKKSGETGRCYYSGCIGTDAFGETLVKRAQEDGVHMLMQVVSDQPTGTCGVVVVGNERSLVANLAASQKFQESHLDSKEVADGLNTASIYYCSGFFITVCFPGMLKVAKLSASKNGTFCVNLSAPFVVEFFGSQLVEIIEHSDIVFGNETEAVKFAQVNNLGTEDISEIAEKIQKMKNVNGKERIVIITQGPNPTVLATAEGVKTYDVDKVPSDKIVDTNGAGDAFVGGFLAMFAKGSSLEHAIKIGNYAAGEIIQQSGCCYNESPSFDL